MKSRQLKSRASRACAFVLAGVLTFEPAMLFAQTGQDQAVEPKEISFRDYVRQQLKANSDALQRLSEQVQRQQQLLERQEGLIATLLPQVITAMGNRATLQQQVAQGRADLQSAADSVIGESKNALQPIVSTIAELAPKIEGITATTPKESVEELLRQLAGARAELRSLEEKERQKLGKAIEACAKTSLGQVLISCTGTRAGDSQARVLLALLEQAPRSSCLPETIPEGCLDDLRTQAENTTRVEDASQQADLVMNAMVLMALQTGNPYVIAAAVLFALLTSGSGGRGGDGDGEGEGTGTGAAGTGAITSTSSTDTDTEQPSTDGDGGAETVSNQASLPEIKPGADIAYTGGFPLYTFSAGGGGFRLNMEDVFTRVDKNQKLTFVPGQFTIQSADVQNRSVIVVTRGTGGEEQTWNITLEDGRYLADDLTKK